MPTKRWVNWIFHLQKIELRFTSQPQSDQKAKIPQPKSPNHFSRGRQRELNQLSPPARPKSDIATAKSATYLYYFPFHNTLSSTLLFFFSFSCFLRIWAVFIQRQRYLNKYRRYFWENSCPFCWNVLFWDKDPSPKKHLPTVSHLDWIWEVLYIRKVMVEICPFFRQKNSFPYFRNH